MDDLVNSSNEEIARVLSTLILFGRYEAMVPFCLTCWRNKQYGSPNVDARLGVILATTGQPQRVDGIKSLHRLADLAVFFSGTVLRRKC